jgi:hypothetical protein
MSARQRVGIFASAFLLVGCANSSPQTAETEYVRELSDFAVEVVPVDASPEQREQSDVSPILDSCPGKALITRATPRVQPDDSAPLAHAVGNNSWVFVCGQRRDAPGWVAIIYSDEMSLAECDGHYPIDGSKYEGPCPMGWVREEALTKHQPI